MNIGEHLGKSCYISDMGAACLPGSARTGGNPTLHPEESSFQRLMLRMMTAGFSSNAGNTGSAGSMIIPDGKGHIGAGSTETEGMEANSMEIEDMDILKAGMFFASAVSTGRNPLNVTDEGVVQADLSASEPAASKETVLRSALPVNSTPVEGPMTQSFDAGFENPITGPKGTSVAGAADSAIAGNPVWSMKTAAVQGPETGRNAETVVTASKPAGSGKIDHFPSPMTISQVSVGVNDLDSAIAQENASRENSGIHGLTAARGRTEANGTEHTLGSTETAEYFAYRESANILQEQRDPGTDSIEGSLKSSVYQGLQQTAPVNGAAESFQPVQQPGAPEAYSQIREEILSRLEQKGPAEFKMQLQPKDLGQIDVSMKLSEGKLIIDIMAANSKTQALLAGQVDKLISSLGLQNVQVESIQTSQQMNSQNQDSSQGQGYSMNSAMDFFQRKQQEQYGQEFANNPKPGGGLSANQDEAQVIDQADRIGSIRHDFSRMNYTV